MDAAKFSFSKTALLLPFALLIPASAFAQTPAFNLASSNTNATAVTLIGNQSSSVSVTSSLPGTSEISYSATTVYDSTSNGIQWLCLNPSPAGVINGTCDQVSGLTTPNTFFIQIGQQANSSQLTQTLHTATITLTGTGAGAPTGTITVNYTPGSSSGNTAGAVAASPSALTATVGYQGYQIVNFQLTSNSTTPVAYALVAPTTTNANATWATNFVTTSGFTSGTVYSGNPASIQVTLSGAGQPQTTLNTTLQVNYGSGNVLSIPVTFGNGVNVGNGGSSGSGTLSFSPTSLTWTSSAGSFPATSYVNVSSTGGAIGFGITTSSSNNWLTAFSSSTNLPATLTVQPTGNVAALATGVYTGTVTVNGSDGSSQSIFVTLTVNGGSSNGVTVSPNPISLQTPVNGSTVSQSVTVTSVTGGSLFASVSGTGLSVTVGNSSITANQPTTVITVSGNPTGLTNGTYIGTLTVTAGGVSQAVQVTFIVGTGNGSTGGGSTSSISAAPSALNFIYQIGSGIPTTQQQQLYVAGSGNYTATANAQSGGNWLTVSNTTGTLPAPFFYIYANATNLAAGTYTGSVTFTNTGTSLTSVVSVNLVVTGATVVYASPGDLVFNYIANTTSAQQFQTVTLGSGSNSILAVSAAVSNPTSTPWLTVSNNGYTATPAILSVTVNASSLANGLYTGYINVTTGGTNTTLTIPVALNVVGSSISTGGGSGSLTLGTSSLTFTPAVNGSAVTQQLAVSATTSTSFTANATTSNGNNTWLSVSPAGSSVTNTTLTVTANPAGLAAGTYNGQITLVSNSGTQTVPVTMVVGGSSGTSGSITVTANGDNTNTSPSLTFTAQSLGASVLPQYLTVTSAAGSSGVTFAASLSGSNCSWVNLGITANQQYATPVPNLNVGATTTGFAAGTYTCSLSLTPTGGTAVTVPLTLTVVGVPTISIATTTLSFAYAAGSASPASQTIQVTATGASAPTFTSTATSTPSGWLSVTPASGSVTVGTPTSLTVSVNPANLAAGTYTGTISIAAGSGSSGSGTVTVTLTVTAPSPTINTIVNGASFLGGAISPGEFVSLLGTQLGPITPLGPALDATGKVATTLGNVQVFFGGTPAAITYVSSGQINCTVPYEVAGLSTIGVQVKYLAQPSNSITMNVATSAPGIFTATGTGTGQGAVLNQNFTLNTAGNPAAKGTVIQIYMTGEGVTSPAGVNGAITSNATTVPVLPIAVKIGGQPATVVFAGEAPGIVAGVLQLNVTVPPTVTSGTNTLVVTIGNNTSQSGLTVAVQ